MASSGQASSHRPHSRQCEPSILYISSSEITLTGQASRQRPQAVHLEVIRYPTGLTLLPPKANRSRMGAETVRRALDLCHELHGRLPARVELVLNGFLPDEPLAGEMTALASGDNGSFSRVWTIPQDQTVSSAELAGRSLLELAPQSPAFRVLAGWEDVR